MVLFNKEYQGWSFERIIRHVIYWSFWLTFYGIVNGSYYGKHYFEWFLFELITMTVKLPYTYLVAYYLFPKFIPREQYIMLGVYVLGYAFLGMLALMGIYQLFPYDMPGGATDFWSTKTVYMFADLIYVASPVVVIKMTQKFLIQERTAAKLKEEKMEAELQMLKNQLQPHFLFNTLNNIYGMVITGEQQAGGALLKLSQIISYMLYECNVDKVDLAKEVNLLRNYIELEKIRYGKRLDLSFDQQGEINGKMIASLLLIPFVENAFKHGVSNDAKYSWVRIYLQIAEQELLFLVENSLPAEHKSIPNLKSGIGIKNVKKRLEICYPGKHSLIFSDNDSFLIKLNIQL